MLQAFFAAFLMFFLSACGKFNPPWGGSAW
jgi:hypothetical protein